MIFLSTLYCLESYAQQDTTVNLDVLKAPTSTAFNLLDFSPSAIERPSDVNAFALSLQSTTKNFSSLPNSYAVEFAPIYLTKKRTVSLSDMNSAAFKEVFRQSFLLSVGYTHLGPEGQEDVDSLRQSKIGIGFKFSIIRPHFSNKTVEVYNRLLLQQQSMLDFVVKGLGNDAEITEIEDSIKNVTTIQPDLTKQRQLRIMLIKRLGALDSIRNSLINIQLPEQEAFKEAKKLASDFKIERKGLFLDLAAGIVLDFTYDFFNRSKVTKSGAWLTGGYENGSNGISSLAILRYLYQPDNISADNSGILLADDLSTLDAGGRFILSGAQGRLSLSAEGIYRSVLAANTVAPSWRFVLNIEYDIGVNKILTFAFGRNFDGSVTKGGNVIAALNFASSFGSSRKISH